MKMQMHPDVRDVSREEAARNPKPQQSSALSDCIPTCIIPMKAEEFKGGKHQ